MEQRWHGPEPRVSARPDQLSTLRDRTVLHLGDSDRLGTLLAVLPRGYTAMTDPDEMLSELLPDYAGADPWSEPMLQAEAELHSFGEPFPGLFWKGYPHCLASAWTHALAGSRGGAGARVLVGPLPRALSADLAPDRAELLIDGLGRVSVDAPPTLVGWSHAGTAHALDQGRWRAALTDYYLWWAHRLHSYATEVSGSRWDLYLARLAARRGAREIGRLGAFVRHLDEHLADEAGEAR